MNLGLGIMGLGFSTDPKAQGLGFVCCFSRFGFLRCWAIAVLTGVLGSLDCWIESCFSSRDMAM